MFQLLFHGIGEATTVTAPFFCIWFGTVDPEVSTAKEDIVQVIKIRQVTISESFMILPEGYFGIIQDSHEYIDKIISVTLV